MLSIGYVIREDGISFDLRADGRFAAQTRVLRHALEKGLVTIVRILSNL
jgi:hypothetical protein